MARPGTAARPGRRRGGAGARPRARGRPVAHPDDTRDPAADPVDAAGGPRDLVVEEERLADGRYVLYYAWPRRDGAGEAGTGRARGPVPGR